MSDMLKRTRINAGLTMQQVVSRAGISRPTVERAEEGKKPVSIVNAVRIVNAINELAGTSYTIEELEILTA